MADISYLSKTKPQGKYNHDNDLDIILEPPIEFWNIETQFSRAGRYLNHPTILPPIKLMDT